MNTAISKYASKKRQKSILFFEIAAAANTTHMQLKRPPNELYHNENITNFPAIPCPTTDENLIQVNIG